MLYFAYGSNLNFWQMRWRCPDAIPVGPLLLPNARLVFRGVCDVVFEEGATCPGGLWRITPECEEALDHYEGWQPGDNGMYSKDYIPVDGLPDGETHVMVYVMNSTGIFPPSRRYFDGVRQGYRDFGLDAAPLRDALERSYEDKAPSYVERQRMRRTGRPQLKPRPSATPAPAPVLSRKAKRKAAKAQSRAVKTSPQMWLPLSGDRLTDRAAVRARAQEADKESRKLKETARQKYAHAVRRGTLAAWLDAKSSSGDNY